MSDADEADLGALLDEIGCARAVVSVLAAVPRSCHVSVVALQNQKFRPTHPRMNPPSLISNQTNRTAWLADRAHAAAAAAAGSARLRRLRHQRRGGGRCWRVDTGMSRMMGGPCEVLELLHYRRDGGRRPRITVLTEEAASPPRSAPRGTTATTAGAPGAGATILGILLGMFS